MRKRILMGLAVVAVVAQFFQPERKNPPTDPESSYEAAAKPAPELAAALRRACYDCHSNQTRWPWYSRVAPVSWLIASDVREGRAHLNFSEWNRYSPEAARRRMEEACEEVRAGRMPLRAYLLIHAEARLTPMESELICQAARGMGGGATP
ncbi:MAG: heme-binding domain-containing protein [Bryobacterales bacterium]|nr:heme-binding domain-containing protein [Bryobacteraceae bacterium]MDW8129838.1 heme-binding domain-containing protein [Bryobacterales bacterium]